MRSFRKRFYRRLRGKRKGRRISRPSGRIKQGRVLDICVLFVTLGFIQKKEMFMISALDQCK